MEFFLFYKLGYYNLHIFLKSTFELIDLVYMGNQARKLIEEEYDNEKCSNRLLNIYHDIYNGNQNSKDWII